MNQMHNLPPHGMGMSPMMQQQQQPSPQQQHLQQQQQLMQGGIGNQVPSMVHPQPQQQQQQQQVEKIDNITKVKSLVVPLRESLLVRLI